MFYWGAGVVLVVSFVAARGALAAAAARRHASGRPLWAAGLSRLVLGPLRVVVQVLSVVLFGLVWAAALFGDTDPFRNLAPTWIYVIFWLGVPALSVVFGNVWRALALARDRRRVRLGPGAGLGRGAAARGVPRAARALARPRSRSSRSSRSSSRTPIPRARGRSRSRSRSTRTSRCSGWPRSGGRRGSGTARRSRCCSVCSRASRRSTRRTAGSACAGRSPGWPAPSGCPGRSRSSP